MFVYILAYMLLGWILSWFGFDVFIINGVAELFGKAITTTGYYLITALMGLVTWFVVMFTRGGNG